MMPCSWNNPFETFSYGDGDYRYTVFVDVGLFQDCVICSVTIDNRFLFQ